MPDGDEQAVALTYAELATARQISKASAERLVRNHKWPRTMGNDGKVRVLLPPRDTTPEITPEIRHETRGRRRAGRPAREITPDNTRDFRGVIEAAVAPIREQLDRAEQKSAALQAELVELRVSERASAELAKYATDEATDLRNRLDSAEQRAGEERARANQIERQLTAVETELVAAGVEAAGLRCKLEQVRPKPPRSAWRRFLAWRRGR